MTEKELVDKLKAGLRVKAQILKQDLREEKNADLRKYAGKEKEKGEIEKLYKEDFKRHNEMVTRIDKATKVRQLTSLVRDYNWDAEAWTHFILDTAFETDIEIGDLSGFDT